MPFLPGFHFPVSSTLLPAFYPHWFSPGPWCYHPCRCIRLPNSYLWLWLLSLTLGPSVQKLPWWLSGKESACNAEDRGSIPGLERSLRGGHGNPLQYSCLENPMDRGAWQGHKQSGMTEWLNHHQFQKLILEISTWVALLHLTLNMYQTVFIISPYRKLVLHSWPCKSTLFSLFPLPMPQFKSNSIITDLPASNLSSVYYASRFFIVWATREAHYVLHILPK